MPPKDAALTLNPPPNLEEELQSEFPSLVLEEGRWGIKAAFALYFGSCTSVAVP